MDVADRAERYEQKFRDDAIKSATSGGVHKDGPMLCAKCGDDNDRRREGYAVCSSCVEAPDDR